ncbi:hypothetical protein L6164_018512 [Bauhinia variegata]|uniref:Uncharacterized protein n=1 Tax=Bauhinia variegata TaxID=167791 RepID=A0ACB9NC59_BAUVA|nr:hypothetical protein L6164_018512 [Bauhinia variegata]
MSYQKYVKVESLSLEEAWALFVDNLGQQTTLSPEITKVARSIAKECAGLPLGIITMARSMRGVEDICEWRDALEKLRSSEIRQEEMETEVFHVLRFSFDRLNDKMLQECFLYCALYPEDFEINREMLIENFIKEGLVNGMKSLEAAFDEGYTILNKIENNCLLGKVENYVGGNKCIRLQDSSSHIVISMLKKGSQYVAPVKNADGYYVENKVVKMHDLMWTMAISIIKENAIFMVKPVLLLTQIPDEEEWTEDLEKVSLMSNWIHEIPAGTSPRCPKRRTLILKQNESLTRISDSFFACMPALQVLDLSFTDIEILPNSVSDLKTLSSLLLSSCKRLVQVPSLANLQALIRLDLSYTAITEIPQDVIYKRNCQIDSPSIPYSSLVVQKDLYDRHHFNAYVKVMQNSGPKNYLLQLDSGQFPAEAQQIYFTEVCFGKDVIITSCNLRTGEIPLMLPRDAQLLKIERCHDFRSVFDILLLKNATSLRRCEIVDCEGKEYLLSLSCSSSCCNSRKNLESVELSNLKSLRCLCKEDEAVAQALPPQRAFAFLKYFCVYHCPNLTKLLTPGMIAILQNSKEITVHHCESMKETISVAATKDVEGIDDKGSGSNPSGMDHSDAITFTHAKFVSLSLKYLPELQCICRGLMVCESLQKFRIYRCAKLMLPETVPPVQTLYG